MINSEYLRNTYQKNNRNDFTMDFVRYNAPFLAHVQNPVFEKLKKLSYLS